MTTAIEIQRTPDVIAAEINNIKSQTRTMVLCNSIEIGRRLVEAKAMMEHGQWGTWIESSVEYSKSTANNLMRIFDEYGANQTALFGDNTKSQALGNLSYTQAVALLGVPEEEREQFIEEHDIEGMSTRELQAAIKERDEALKKLETAQDDKHQAEANLRVTDKAFREAQADVKMLQDTYQKDKERTKAEIAKLENSLAAVRNSLLKAAASGDSEEEKRLQESLKQTETELGSANDKIKELERQLKEKPIDVPATIEKIPDEVVTELEELRKKHQSAAAIKFRLYFDELVNGFKALLSTLDEMADDEERDKYKKATAVMIGKMTERL